MFPLLHVGVGGPRWLDWTVHIDAIILCFVLAYGYYYAVTELRPRVSDAGKVKRSQVLLYSAGLLALYVAGGTPLHDLGEQYWLSAHMMQHLLFTLVAPPLLIAGTPGWLWKWLLVRRRVLPAARWLTHPVPAMGMFNFLLLLTHLPPTVDMALRVGALHFAIHAALVLTAMLMWWPVLSPIEELPRLSPPLQMSYLFLQSLLPAVMASFITFTDSAVYPAYRHAPRLLGVSALADQQLAGGLMKLFGSIILWSMMGYVFFKWYNREEAESQSPHWHEVQQELEELGLAKK